ncbi:hypothetical protein [Legionella septentrionalis]|uniref:hypothetical protein n=1 Tax=Legionella septentrionalis TaxID=2498109 RepID=UPI000F8F7981|nr:hypothetical protein [Legionella septentrionalis]RUR11857.1 hypothetical protein ELY14_01025 [Legionella septentrionalis]
MKLNILFLCDKPTGNANTILDHISAFETYSNHTIWTYSNLGDFSPKLQLARFDAIIVHYSLSLLYDHFISPAAKRQLREFSGLKVLFVQDEYRQINKLIEQIKLIEFDVLFTCFPEAEIEKIYSRAVLPNLLKYNNLTGYIPEKLAKLAEHKHMAEREIDVGYRGRKIPYWLGELAYEKWSIVEKWRQYAADTDLRVDISYKEEERIYGIDWINFLSSCKTTLGVESGASVMDFTGKLEKIIDFHQQNYPEDSFQEIQQMYLKEHEGKCKLNQISPRCFEAIALKTVLVLYEGEYSGILIPERHYIPLKKDFSNISAVIAKIKNIDYLQNMADTAFAEIAQNPKYSYKTFIHRVDEIISSAFAAKDKKKVAAAYTEKEFNEEILVFNAKLVREVKTTLYNTLIINNNRFFQFIKFLITRKIRLFNPLLRLVKNKIQL